MFQLYDHLQTKIKASEINKVTPVTGDTTENHDRLISTPIDAAYSNLTLEIGYLERYLRAVLQPHPNKSRCSTYDVTLVPSFLLASHTIFTTHATIQHYVIWASTGVIRSRSGTFSVYTDLTKETETILFPWLLSYCFSLPFPRMPQTCAQGMGPMKTSMATENSALCGLSLPWTFRTAFHHVNYSNFCKCRSLQVREIYTHLENKSGSFTGYFSGGCDWSLLKCRRKVFKLNFSDCACSVCRQKSRFFHAFVPRSTFILSFIHFLPFCAHILFVLYLTILLSHSCLTSLCSHRNWLHYRRSVPLMDHCEYWSRL
jgi:hypothetical protein